MSGNFGFRRIDTVHQSKTRQLPGLDYAAAKRALSDSQVHMNSFQPFAFVPLVSPRKLLACVLFAINQNMTLPPKSGCLSQCQLFSFEITLTPGLADP